MGIDLTVSDMAFKAVPALVDPCHNPNTAPEAPDIAVLKALTPGIMLAKLKPLPLPLVDPPAGAGPLAFWLNTALNMLLFSSKRSSTDLGIKFFLKNAHINMVSIIYRS
jgi:hypothetical protein